jgi:hypothetical protein
MTDAAIQPGRGGGVWVEQQPFGSVWPGLGGRRGPRARVGAAGEGAYVEFDRPPGTMPVPQIGGNSALIPCQGPLVLEGLNPAFVIVKRWWLGWMLWRGNGS